MKLSGEAITDLRQELDEVKNTNKDLKSRL